MKPNVVWARMSNVYRLVTRFTTRRVTPRRAGFSLTGLVIAGRAALRAIGAIEWLAREVSIILRPQIPRAVGLSGETRDVAGDAGGASDGTLGAASRASSVASGVEASA